MGCKAGTSCNGACNPAYAMFKHSSAWIAFGARPGSAVAHLAYSLPSWLFWAVLGRAAIFRALIPDEAAREGAPLHAVRLPA